MFKSFTIIKKMQIFVSGISVRQAFFSALKIFIITIIGSEKVRSSQYLELMYIDLRFIVL